MIFLITGINHGDRVKYFSTFPKQRPPISTQAKTDAGWVALPRPTFWTWVFSRSSAKALTAWERLFQGLSSDQEEAAFTDIFDAAIVAGIADDDFLMPRGFESITHPRLIGECRQIHQIHNDVFGAILWEFFKFGLTRRR